jgi:SIR2-like domain
VTGIGDILVALADARHVRSPMRFLENSPDIPDELIRAVSAGEVMFLCGAGVSFGAGLPTFKDLTKQVYATLGEDLRYEHAELTAFNQNEFDRALRSLEKRTNLPGMDSSVRTAVMTLLQPPSGADLSRHLSILQLSRDRQGRAKITTTNFDTLFERAAEQHGIPWTSHAGKSLPRAGTPADHGILHLHGRLGDSTLSILPSDLILTSADFGDAYLRDGWASRYIEDRMRLNTMVLVGYRAEDAAMRLLLETLDADRERFTDLRDIYAMEVQQDGSASIWKAKGIKPVEFADYGALYTTLAEWAKYAMDPNGYQLAKARAILGKKI